LAAFQNKREIQVLARNRQAMERHLRQSKFFGGVEDTRTRNKGLVKNL